MPNCQCTTCNAERWATTWREQHNNSFTLSRPADAPTPSVQDLIAERRQGPRASSTATGAHGAGKISGSREDRMRLVMNLSRLNDWEIQPLLFLSERLLKGQGEYGPERKYRDWAKDIAEEAADIVAYYAWRRFEENEW